MAWKPGLTTVTNNKRLVRGGGSLDSRRKHTRATVEQLRKVRDEIKISCEYASEIFSQLFGMEIVWDCTSLLKRMDSPENQTDWLDRLSSVIQGKFKGTLTREHILTLGSLCHQFINVQDRDILLWGACQSAKTIILAAQVLVAPVLYKLLGHGLLIPVIDTPNRKNLSLSVLKEIDTLASVYEDVNIIVNGESLSLRYVKTEILDKIVKSKMGAGTPTWECLIFQRNKPEILKFIKLMEDDNETVTRMRIIDEIHHGSGETSLQTQMDEEYKDQGNWRRVGVTATPSEQLTRLRWAFVPLWLDERKFCGITCYAGRCLPTISKNRPPRPRHIVIEERFPELSPFINVKKFENMPQNQQVEMARVLLDAYKELVTPQHPVFFCRPFNGIPALTTLLNIMKNLNGDERYCFLPYFDNLPDTFGIPGKTVMRTVKEVLIDDYPAHSGKFCMVLSGKGRSQFGDSYPSHCAHYLDMTDKGKSFWDVILQSTEGRAGGFNKQHVVLYFSQNYVSEFKKFVDSGYVDNRVTGRKRHGQRTTFSDQVERKGRGRESEHQEIILKYN